MREILPGLWQFTSASEAGAWAWMHTDQLLRVFKDDRQDLASEEDRDQERFRWTEAGTAEEVLQVHLAALIAGELRWNPWAATFLHTDERSDLAWLEDAAAAAGVEAFVQSVTRSLVEDGKHVVDGFGVFSVSRRRSFAGRDVPSGRFAIPVFRAGRGLKRWVQDADARVPISDPMLAIIARCLQQQVKVGLPGLGELSLSIRPAFRGHNPSTGAEMQVPQSKLPVFRSWRTLTEMLNPPR